MFYYVIITNSDPIDPKKLILNSTLLLIRYQQKKNIYCKRVKFDRYKILESYNSNVYRIQDELSTCIYILKVCQNYETKRYKHQFKTEIDVLSKLNSFLALKMRWLNILLKHIFQE